MASNDLKLSLSQNGYVIVPSHLPPTTLAHLRTLASHVTHLSRTGSWPHIRTLPRQFPPWPSDPSPGIWGVQQLLNPSLPGHETFTQAYFNPSSIAVVRELLDCRDEDLVMELFNLLVTPDHDFQLRWHRDDIPPEATAEQELARLAQPAFHAQWNLALYDDESLVVVPGSHKRARTEIERIAGPYDELPGEMRVALKAGEMVFYDNNILHRGVYSKDVERATLHGSMGHVKGGGVRARNVLQHGRGWIGEVDLGVLPEGEERERAEGMRRRLVELGERAGEVGFSQGD